MPRRGVNRGGRISVALGAAWLLLAGGCSLPPLAGWRPAPGPAGGRYVEVGVASWYGPGFHGNRTSNGEVYDSSDMTAAHQTLPHGTRLAVTNLDNGKSVEVRVNDRGPFAKGRIIDLSHAAAREIGMVGPGTAQVRLESIDEVDGPPGVVAYAVQAGAFRDGARALALRSDLAGRLANVYMSELRTGTARYYRVRVGPFDRRNDAFVLARELSRGGLPAMIVEETRR
ncbi:MAG: septal ring lytic transglycosylase RlpA family protein [Deltaproteobacteria bacterium]|nr:septal ring lytic transglycosylase RlpA family protein [Deltaproteobacteria bacterium]